MKSKHVSTVLAMMFAAAPLTALAGNSQPLAEVSEILSNEAVAKIIRETDDKFVGIENYYTERDGLKYYSLLFDQKPSEGFTTPIRCTRMLTLSADGKNLTIFPDYTCDRHNH